MKIRLFFIFLIFQPILIIAQNYIPNPGFEEFISHKFDGKNGKWEKCSKSDSPDYFTDSICSVLFSKYIGDARPHTGKAFVGLFVYRKKNKKNEIREFIRVPLTQQLKKDTIYYAEAFVYPDPESNVICDGFGLVLCDTIIKNIGTDQLIKMKPQVSNKPGHLLEKGKEWIKISCIFKATGKEKYAILGNFKPDSETQIQDSDEPLGSEKNKKWYLKTGEKVAYLYIDDITICPDLQIHKYPLLLMKIIPCRPLPLVNLPSPAMVKRINNKTDSLTKINYAKSEINSPKSIDSIDIYTLNPGQSFVLKNILFDFDESDFKEESIFDLNELLRLLRKIPSMNIEIRGYTDNIGTTQHNIDLSIARANSVKIFLIKNGIEKNRIECYGYGSSNPIDDNNDEEGRANNRRIEIFITNK